MSHDAEQLIATLPNLPWFANVGSYVEHAGVVALRNLDAWADGANGPTNVADLIQWLPTARDDAGSVPNLPLRQRADAAVEELVSRAYKATLASLRPIPSAGDPRFMAGVHDFTPAARGAALVAVVQTVREIASDDSTFWRSIFRTYALGHWPMGKLPAGALVIF